MTPDPTPTNPAEALAQTAAEALLLWADYEEAVAPFVGADDPDTESPEFLWAIVMQSRINALKPAYLRTLAKRVAENEAQIRGAEQLGEALKAHRAAALAATPAPAEATAGGVWLVWDEPNGTHENRCLETDIWVTQAEAETECARLTAIEQANDFPTRTYWAEFRPFSRAAAEVTP